MHEERILQVYRFFGLFVVFGDFADVFCTGSAVPCSLFSLPYLPSICTSLCEHWDVSFSKNAEKNRRNILIRPHLATDERPHLRSMGFFCSKSTHSELHFSIVPIRRLSPCPRPLSCPQKITCFFYSLSFVFFYCCPRFFFSFLRICKYVAKYGPKKNEDRLAYKTFRTNECTSRNEIRKLCFANMIYLLFSTPAFPACVCGGGGRRVLFESKKDCEIICDCFFGHLIRFITSRLPLSVINWK